MRDIRSSHLVLGNLHSEPRMASWLDTKMSLTRCCVKVWNSSQQLTARGRDTKGRVDTQSKSLVLDGTLQGASCGVISGQGELKSWQEQLSGERAASSFLAQRFAEQAGQSRLGPLGLELTCSHGSSPMAERGH